MLNVLKGLTSIPQILMIFGVYVHSDDKPRCAKFIAHWISDALFEGPKVGLNFLTLKLCEAISLVPLVQFL